MTYTYKTSDTCSTSITFDIDNDVISNIQFEDGCPGNLCAVSALCDGMTVEQIEHKLSGIRCGDKETSCAHQLSLAVRAASNQVHSVIPE